MEASRRERESAEAEGAARRRAELEARAAQAQGGSERDDSEYDLVRVFFATDRKATGDGIYGGDRGSGLNYGSVYVSIPKGHEVGAIERPSIWRLEFHEDPRRHMVIVHRAVTDPDLFFADVRATVARGGAEASFLFVHGYNVAFDDAARRTAQIAFDLRFPGAPVFYSWPSQAALHGYTIDENNVEWSQANLKAFLVDYAARSGAREITLIAHSMGNRALLRAVTGVFTEHPDLRGRFREIILTAPDVDADVFKRDIAPKLVSGCDKITLYVSAHDKALLASRTVHGYPRLGDSEAGITVLPGIETVDASGLDTSFLEHSYFAESHSVLGDIRRLVREGLRAAQRGLVPVPVSDSDLGYWRVPAP